MCWELSDGCALVYARAAAIRVISQGFADNLREKGVADDKIHLIANWSEEQSAESDRKDSPYELKQDGRFNVLYAGNIGFAQDWKIFWTALNCCGT